MKTLLSLFIAISVLAGCKDDEPPTFTGPWDYRLLSIGNPDYFWYIGRIDSTMYDIAADSVEVHSGKWSAHVFSVADSPSSIGYVARNMDPDLIKARRVTLTAWAKAENVSGSAQIFVRLAEDPTGMKEKSLGKKVFEQISKFAGVENDELPEWVFFNGEVPIQADSVWTQHDITFDVPQKTVYMWFGAILDGKGKIWVDDFSYKVISRLPTDSSYKDVSSYIAKPMDLDFE